jgi:hypothetical protein
MAPTTAGADPDDPDSVAFALHGARATGGGRLPSDVCTHIARLATPRVVQRCDACAAALLAERVSVPFVTGCTTHWATDGGAWLSTDRGNALGDDAAPAAVAPTLVLTGTSGRTTPTHTPATVVVDLRDRDHHRRLNVAYYRNQVVTLVQLAWFKRLDDGTAYCRTCVLRVLRRKRRAWRAWTTAATTTV